MCSANLAVGGKVIGDTIECPFHKWTFRGTDGKCTHIPYAKTPEFAKTASYEVKEWYGHILVWFHTEGVNLTLTLALTLIGLVSHRR